MVQEQFERVVHRVLSSYLSNADLNHSSIVVSKVRPNPDCGEYKAVGTVTLKEHDEPRCCTAEVRAHFAPDAQGRVQILLLVKTPTGNMLPGIFSYQPGTGSVITQRVAKNAKIPVEFLGWWNLRPVTA